MGRINVIKIQGLWTWLYGNDGNKRKFHCARKYFFTDILDHRVLKICFSDFNYDVSTIFLIVFRQFYHEISLSFRSKMTENHYPVQILSQWRKFLSFAMMKMKMPLQHHQIIILAVMLRQFEILFYQFSGTHRPIKTWNFLIAVV